MMERIRRVWQWYWRDRRGLLLFISVRGVRRLVFEIPLLFLVVYAAYRWFVTFLNSGQQFIISALENPFFAVAVLMVLVHEFGVRYIRDQLVPESDFAARLALLVPGRAIRLYSLRYGLDWTARTLSMIRIVAVVSGGIGLIWSNWGRIHG
jgi:hypothetical protein